MQLAGAVCRLAGARAGTLRETQAKEYRGQDWQGGRRGRGIERRRPPASPMGWSVGGRARAHVFHNGIIEHHCQLQAYVLQFSSRQIVCGGEQQPIATLSALEQRAGSKACERGCHDSRNTCKTGPSSSRAPQMSAWRDQASTMGTLWFTLFRLVTSSLDSQCMWTKIPNPGLAPQIIGWRDHARTRGNL